MPTFPYARGGMCEGRTICGSSLRVLSGQALPLYGIVCVPPTPAKKTPPPICQPSPTQGEGCVKGGHLRVLPSRSIRAAAAPLRKGKRSPDASKKDAPAHMPTFPYARGGMCEGRTICGSSLRVISGQRLPLYGIVCVPPAPAKKTPFGVFFAGAPKGIRTPGLPLRRGTLYPAELLARIG